MKNQFAKSLFFIPSLLIVPVVYVASRLLPWHGEEYGDVYQLDGAMPVSHETPEPVSKMASAKALVTQG